MVIYADDGASQEIPVSEGVLQGEILSPLLFSLYTSNIAEYFINHNSTGLPLNKNKDLQMILYADDMVLLSPTWMASQQNLNIL